MFQKRRQGRKKRRHEYREPRANSFLIVTEGKCTEPSYFKGMKKIIQERIGGMINIVEVPLIEIRGQGRSTGKLIDITEQIVKNAKIMYQMSGLYLIKTILMILIKQSRQQIRKDIRLPGAINHLNIGFICIFIIVMPHFIEISG